MKNQHISVIFHTAICAQASQSSPEKLHTQISHALLDDKRLRNGDSYENIDNE